jgi:2-polyprenyl-6-methoxyphenol hydroxylase-like FAD-dependent oxidoreductase
VHALVEGGSVGGLAAALELRRASAAEVAVYERSAGQMEARGAGVVMRPDVEWLLQAHDADPVERCVPLRERQYLRADGQVTRQAMPQMMTAWDTLYSALRAPLGDVCYRQDSRLVSLIVSDESVEVEFGEGYRSPGDFLVGADGITPACRATLMVEEAGPRYAGCSSRRGVVTA